MVKVGLGIAQYFVRILIHEADVMQARGKQRRRAAHAQWLATVWTAWVQIQADALYTAP
jgi:hypothetical protein